MPKVNKNKNVKRLTFCFRTYTSSTVNMRIIKILKNLVNSHIYDQLFNLTYRSLKYHKLFNGTLQFANR
jgi:hypothetical protein